MLLRTLLDTSKKLYEILLEKHRDSIFSKRPNPISKTIESGTEIFENLSVEEQCEVLIHILEITAINSDRADLQLLGGKKNTGVMRLSKTISNSNIYEILLINQSVTGLYESRIDLKTI